jgi:hypothetical protein
LIDFLEARKISNKCYKENQSTFQNNTFLLKDWCFINNHKKYGRVIWAITYPIQHGAKKFPFECRLVKVVNCDYIASVRDEGMCKEHWLTGDDRRKYNFS